MPPWKWHGGIVHAQPTKLSRMIGPFATATSRGGDANDGVRVVTTLDELESVTLARCYARGVLQGGKGEPKWAYERGVNEKSCCGERSFEGKLRVELTRSNEGEETGRPGCDCQRCE